MQSSLLGDRQSAVPLDRHPFYWLTLALNLRNISLARVLTPLGCTVPQWRVMNILRQYPNLSVGELADKTAVDRTTLTRTLDGLVKSGLLLRDVRPENRRIASLELTEQGQRFFDEILPAVQVLTAVATEGVSQPDVDALVETLKKIVVNLGGSASLAVVEQDQDAQGRAPGSTRTLSAPASEPAIAS